LLGLNIAAYAVVAGVAAFCIYYALAVLTTPADALAGSIYVGVFVAVFVGVFSAFFAYRNSRTK
jgi:hypothetical protein